MTETVNSLEAEFDSCAGAGFGIAGLIRAGADDASADTSLLLWLLVSHALAVGENSVGVVDWLEDQVTLLSVHSKNLGMLLKQRLQDNWAAWMPIILFSPASERQMTWETYCNAFPVQPKEQQAVRELLFLLLSEHGRSLYDPENLPDLPNPERFSSPEHCVTLKLGQTVRHLRDNETAIPRKEIFASWRESLLSSVLKTLPHRISRGFAPQWPLFEDLLLSLLYVAEWQLEPDSRRIPNFIEDYARHPDERLTPNQLALSAALFGWLQGYRQIGYLVQDATWRSVLAQQAMGIAVKRAETGTEGLPLESPVVFYSTESGTRTAFWRFLQVTQIQRKEIIKVKRFLDSATGLWKTERSSEISREDVEFHVAQSCRLRLQV